MLLYLFILEIALKLYGLGIVVFVSDLFNVLDFIVIGKSCHNMWHTVRLHAASGLKQQELLSLESSLLVMAPLSTRHTT